MLLFALALAGQDPPLNPGDPIVEPGMTAVQWVSIEGREAGFGSGEETSVRFFRVARHPRREDSGIDPYWIAKFERRVWGPWPAEPVAVWLDGRRCDAVEQALDDLAVPQAFNSYDSRNIIRSGPLSTPHGVTFALARYGTIGGHEVYQITRDHTGEVLQPVLNRVELALQDCVAGGQVIAEPAATS
jgi:hypothetical protein